MYQKEFDQKLRQNMPKSVLFYGENAYLIDNYIAYYIQKTDAKETLLSLYHDEWNFEQAKAFLSQSSLFGGTNLLIVKQGKKIPKKELDILIALTQNHTDNYFLYAYSGLAKDAKSLQNAYTPKSGGVWVRFFEPHPHEGVAILQQKAQRIKLDIDHYALQHLMLILNNNLALCANELDKLAILNMKVTSKDIDKLVYSTSPLAIEQLLFDLFSQKPITSTLSKLLEIGEDESAIIRATQYFLQQIFLFQAYFKLHGEIDCTAILGYQLPKPLEAQKTTLARNISSASLLKIYEHLLESEIALKKASATQKEVLLYGLLIQLQTLL